MNVLKHKNYRDVLFNNKQENHKIKTIRISNHKLISYEINKISLSCFDDKHYLHDNGLDSYAYDHFKVQSTYQVVQPDSSRTRIIHFAADDGNIC